MIDFVGTTISFRIALWVVMETMHFHITREMYSGGGDNNQIGTHEKWSRVQGSSN